MRCAAESTALGSEHGFAHSPCTLVHNQQYYRSCLEPCVQDVSAKLGLKSVADTEAVVAKAIRDGSVSAALDHDKQWLVSRELGDAYVTDEPQRALHARTAFCMDIHNEAVRAMRFDEANDAAGAPTTQDKKAGIEEAIAAALADDGDDF